MNVETLRPESAEEQMEEALEGAELIVDAVVGTGFKPPLRRGGYAAGEGGGGEGGGCGG